MSSHTSAAGGYARLNRFAAGSRVRRGGLKVAESIWTPGPAALDGNQQLSHKVASYIRESIMVGRFEAGQFLRTETISEQMGVSHTPARAALMLLHSDGTVRWEPRRGFRVTAVTH